MSDTRQDRRDDVAAVVKSWIEGLDVAMRVSNNRLNTEYFATLAPALAQLASAYAALTSVDECACDKDKHA